MSIPLTRRQSSRRLTRWRRGAAAAVPFAGGQTCRAGLLDALPSNQLLCDVHHFSTAGRGRLEYDDRRAFGRERATAFRFMT